MQHLYQTLTSLNRGRYKNCFLLHLETSGGQVAVLWTLSLNVLGQRLISENKVYCVCDVNWDVCPTLLADLGNQVITTASTLWWSAKPNFIILFLCWETFVTQTGCVVSLWVSPRGQHQWCWPRGLVAKSQGIAWKKKAAQLSTTHLRQRPLVADPDVWTCWKSNKA